MKESSSEQLQSEIWHFLKGFVRENASVQLQSVSLLFLKVVRENASEQLQPVIRPFLKGFVRESASEQLQSLIWPLPQNNSREGNN